MREVLKNGGLVRYGFLSLIFLLFFSLFFFIHYIHESGHILFGELNTLLLYGKTAPFSISAWAHHPFFPFLYLPQQTRIFDGFGSVNFALGGPIFTMLVFIALSWLGYKNSNKKYWLLLGLSVVLYEAFGNMMCGTDNPSGNPLALCGHLPVGWIEIGLVAIFAGVFTKAVSERV
jgi:amino acid permease